MSTATVEDFQKNPARLLAAAERGEEVVIARGEKIIARLLPAEHDVEREEWVGASISNLEQAYGTDEPDYSTVKIIERNPDYRP